MALRANEPPGSGEQRPRRVAPPERPVVPAAHQEEPMRQMVVLQRGGERRVLGPELVVRATEEPEVCVRPSKRRCYRGQREARAVPCEQGASMTEDRADVVRALVARPALEHAKLAGVVQSDVERAVPAFGK